MTFLPQTDTEPDTAVTDPVAVHHPRIGRLGRLGRLDPKDLGMAGALVAVVIGAQIAYSGFLEWNNILVLLSQNAPLGIVAVGMTYVMIAGGFDLSVGAIYAFAATMFAKVTISSDPWLAAGCALVAGLVFGLVNGILVARFRINAFIATLGTASTFGGLAFVYSNSVPQTPTDPGFMKLGQNSWGPLPIAVWLMIAIVLVGGSVLSKTVYGRSLYAIGGNEDAARLAGLRVGVLRTSAFATVGVLAALAGIIQASRLGVGQADIGGSIPLDAIAVVVIGGTSLFGGEGAVWRTVIGLFILGAITNVFQSLAVDSNIQSVAKGAIVIGAVALDAWLRKRR